VWTVVAVVRGRGYWTSSGVSENSLDVVDCFCCEQRCLTSKLGESTRRGLVAEAAKLHDRIGEILLVARQAAFGTKMLTERKLLGAEEVCNVLESYIN